MKMKWLQSGITLGAIAFVACNTGQAMAVTITETMDYVAADGAYPNSPDGLWPVVRFDVTNNGGLDVYGLIIGAKPGVYTWGSSTTRLWPFSSVLGPPATLATQGHSHASAPNSLTHGANASSRIPPRPQPTCSGRGFAEEGNGQSRVLVPLLIRNWGKAKVG